MDLAQNVSPPRIKWLIAKTVKLGLRLRFLSLLSLNYRLLHYNRLADKHFFAFETKLCAGSFICCSLEDFSFLDFNFKEIFNLATNGKLKPLYKGIIRVFCLV